VTRGDIVVQRAASSAEVVDRLQRYGVCIIERLATAESIAALDEQIALGDYRSTTATVPGYAGAEVLFKVPASVGLVEHPLVLDSVNGLLGPHCKQLSLKLLTVLSVHPGKPKQRLHREEGLWPAHHFPFPWCVDVLWAATDFTAENGATYFVPRSAASTSLGSRAEDDPWSRAAPRAHWQSAHEYPQCMRAEMPAGSVMLFAGGTLHAAGENSMAGPPAPRNVRKGLLTG
jgi:ectoine hydroxylase-related dioxygenase (phytanoyl-CoA dioxygenase family)